MKNIKNLILIRDNKIQKMTKNSNPFIGLINVEKYII